MLNEQDYIQRCIKSVTVQSYLNWVMYVSDNFSNDASLALAKKESSVNVNIKFIERESRVTSDQNWNTLAELALSETEPEFVMWLGADDFLENADYLENMVGQCEKDAIVPSFRNCREDGSYYLEHIFRTDCTAESKTINQYRLARNWANVVAIYGLYRISVFKELLRGKGSRLTEAPESDWWWCFTLHNRFKITSSQTDYYVKTIKENPFYVLTRKKNSIFGLIMDKISRNLSLRLLVQSMHPRGRINKQNLTPFLFTTLAQVFFMTLKKICEVTSLGKIKNDKV